MLPIIDVPSAADPEISAGNLPQFGGSLARALA